MTIAFLYPLFWLGGLAVAAPLWLHLRRRAETSLVRFSAVQFLDDQPEARRSLVRIQDWLLLALRILALLMLIAAFAWPYLPTESRALVRESRVYVLDNTLSRAVDDGFTTDRDRLLDELAAAGPDVQVAVIELAAVPRVVVEFADGRADAAAELAALEPKIQRGSYLTAVRQAQSLLETSLGQERRVIVLGDSQKNQWESELSVAPFLSNVDVTLPEVSAAVRDNLGVFDPQVRRVFLGDSAVVECDIKVYRQGAIAGGLMRVSVNGEQLDERPVELAKGADTSVLSFRWEIDPQEWVRGEVTIQCDGDALDEDNRAFFALPPIREGTAILLARSPYWRTALSPDVMQGRWNTTMLNEAEAAETTRLAALEPADVLCVEGRFLRTPAARELLERYLSSGRGVMLAVDEWSPAVRSLLLDQGVELRSVANQSVQAATFRYIFFDHPVLRPFRSPDFGSLLDVRVDRYRRLAAPDATPLIFSQDGDVLLFETRRTKGKLLVVPFAFDRQETNWPLNTTFVPFLDLCLQHIRTASDLPTLYEPGEPIVWSVPEDWNATEVVVRDAKSELVRAPVKGGRVEFTTPDKSGLYDVSLDGGRTVAAALEINPPPQESQLEYLAADKLLETWRMPDSARAGGAEQTLGRAASVELTRAEILRQNAWWWLLLGGAALLFGETVWAAVRSAGSGVAARAPG
jgi:Aerotolerance regulator N-terminal